MIARLLWTSAGTLFLAVGVAGVVLPLLPGTIFLLLASVCYLRGSERLYRWLIDHRVLGRHVKVMLGREPMTARSKATAIGAMWTAVAISLLATASAPVQAALVALAVAGTWFILARRGHYRPPRPECEDVAP